jgi:hypothetical protein
MIPSDLASRLQSLHLDQQPSAPQPALPLQKLTDALSDLQPGQRIIAEIQAQLPNGTYRALVGQREITLALPFTAKQGDSLELDVVETDGKLSLAVVAKQAAGGTQNATGLDSVPTTLSQAGKLIGDLLGSIGDQGKRAAPAPLNGNQPLVNKFPANAADLAPVLKEALSKSGVFYEAHQARWVAGQLTTSQLLQEPQGQHSSLTAAVLLNNATGARPNSTPTSSLTAASAGPATPGNAAIVSGINAMASSPAATSTSTAETAASSMAPATHSTNAENTTNDSRAITTQTGSSDPNASAAVKGQPMQIPADLAPLVQQQLDALATQTYAWQGQIWPGQQMSWEIDEQQHRNHGGETDPSAQWQTRLKLNLPQLGGIDASLRLRPGNEVEISLATTDGDSETTLGAAARQLKQQFEAAGLHLTQLVIKHGPSAG